MKIAIVDCGSGNLGSALKAFQHLGADAALCERPEELDRADALVLPGQGQFGDVMKGLASRNLVEPIQAAAKAGKTVFGICIGLQLFFETSEESKGVAGLGLLEGSVRFFHGVSYGAKGGLKVPHMGWSPLHLARPHPCLEGLHGEHVYFVHSYFVLPTQKEDVIAYGEYGRHFCAAAGKGNVVGVQFHPEKSQQAGMRILKNFLAWKP
ncbi:MAG: imidazole glycerol phosphate synthase subunit HisH [Planctomycetes bacterium]|nr:imidazole glycerol phosphate synthase subunit HisH [Planctomycetota bacterium]